MKLDDAAVNTIGLLLLAAIMLIAGFVTGINCGRIEFQKGAVENGFAEYNQTNGNWQWKPIKQTLDEHGNIQNHI